MLGCHMVPTFSTPLCNLRLRENHTVKRTSEKLSFREESGYAGKHIKSWSLETGGVVQWLGALAALVEDLTFLLH